jgi:hypothetical protein
MSIVFTDTSQTIPEEYYPQPASNFVPEWYKNLSSYINGKKQLNGQGGTEGTIKKCMPVFDAITNGYVLLLPADVFVTQKPDPNDPSKSVPYFQWSAFNLIEFHIVEQAPNYPNKKDTNMYPKFINHWSVKTPKGFSTLFIQPMHRESIFTILPGVVDTDKYNTPVNFPFMLNDPNYEGLIPAGTPIAQLIPIKRESWKMKIGKKKELKLISKQLNLLSSKFFD